MALVIRIDDNGVMISQDYFGGFQPPIIPSGTAKWGEHKWGEFYWGQDEIIIYVSENANIISFDNEMPGFFGMGDFGEGLFGIGNPLEPDYTTETASTVTYTLET